MKVVLIFLISSILLCLPTEKSNYKKRSAYSKKELKSWDVDERSILIATQTGNKSEVPRYLINVYKRFGLLHLMTPSGIHLSSLLMFLFIFIRGKKKLFIYLPLLIISFFVLGFYSLKRIIYFHLFKTVLGNTKYSFLLTFLTDLIFGGYLLSPMSFTFSFLCWGVIIFSESKAKLLVNLFATQLFISAFMEQELNFLGILVNPFFTGLFSSSFPLMSLNFWILNFSWLYSTLIFFINLFNESLVFLSTQFNFLNFYSSFSITLLFILTNIGLPNKRVIVLLIFLHTSPFKIESHSSSHPSFLATDPKRSQTLKVSHGKYFYFNRVCKRMLRNAFWDISCKKKALRYGGPELY